MWAPFSRWAIWKTPSHLRFGMDLMYQGVVTRQISLSRWVELTATTPARMFGIHGKKGVIQPGADADLVIYDPAGHTSIGYEKTHHMLLSSTPK